MHKTIDAVLSAPWWISAVVGAAVVALLLFAFLTPDRRLRRGALMASAAAAVWLVTAMLIATPTERARARTEAMIAAYDQADWQQLGQLLDEETRFAGILKGQEIAEVARLTHQELSHQGRIRVGGIETRRDDVGVLVFVRVGIEATDQFTYRGYTGWKFDYRKRGDEWRLERIDPIAEQIDPAVILRNLRIPPEIANRQP